MKEEEKVKRQILAERASALMADPGGIGSFGAMLPALEKAIEDRVRKEQMGKKRIITKNKKPLSDDDPDKIWITVCGRPVTGQAGKRLLEIHRRVEQCCQKHPEMIRHLRGGDR